MAILECKGLCKSYGAEPALDRVDLSVEPGHIVGLLGPNGSGKTTLLKLANGLLQPTEGVVKIAGMTPGPETKEIVSYLPDADWLPDWMRVEELVNMFRDFYGTPCEAKAYIGFDAAKAKGIARKGTGNHLKDLKQDEYKQQQRWLDKQRFAARARLVFWIVSIVLGIALCAWGIWAVISSNRRAQYHGSVEY